MAAATYQRPGAFDVARNIETLRNRLAVLEKRTRPGTAFEVVIAHMQGHPNGTCPVTGVKDGKRQSTKTCAVALALLELARYEALRDTAKPLIDLAREATAFLSALESIADPFRRALQAHEATAAAHHAEGDATPLDGIGQPAQRGPYTSHDCRVRCEAPAIAWRSLSELERATATLARCGAASRAWRSLEELRAAAETLAVHLPAGIDSAEITAASNTPVGPDPQILLRQVEAWLRAGGFSQSKVAELINDGSDQDKAKRTERVRFRERSPVGPPDSGATGR